MKTLPPALRAAGPLEEISRGADHMDVKTFATDRPLRAFVLDFTTYCPGWLRGLYALRGALARLLGLQHTLDGPSPLAPEDVPMDPGGRLGFLTVTAAEEDRYWIAEASDRHLTGHVAVVPEATEAGPVVHVLTVVHYRHWTGPVYFGIIRPFHHLVVRAMGRHAAGARPGGN